MVPAGAAPLVRVGVRIEVRVRVGARVRVRVRARVRVGVGVGVGVGVRVRVRVRARLGSEVPAGAAPLGATGGDSGGGSGVAASAGSGLVVSLLVTPGAGLGDVEGPACGSSAMRLAACQGEDEGWEGVAERFGSTLRRSGSRAQLGRVRGGVQARCLLCDHLELLRRHVRHLLHEIAHHGLRWRLLHLDGERC